MKFKKVIIKNFLSFGNAPEEIELDKQKVIHIIGNNAAGKSTIANAITFALFGKGLKNLKKGELVNNINKKDCEVQLYFENSGIEYKIIRGLAPNKLEIYKNGQLIDQSAKVIDYQYLLERDIIKMNYELFTQLIVLSGAHFIPFFRMKNTARKKFLEDLLSLNELALMEKVIKGRLLDIKNKKNELISALSEVNNSILHQSEILKKTKESKAKQDSDKQQEINKIQEEISKLIESKKEINEKLLKINAEELVLTKTKLEDKFNQLQKQLFKIHNDLESIHESVDYISNNNNCSLCKQEITEEYKAKILSSYNPIITDKNTKRSEIMKTSETISIEIDKITESLNEHTVLSNTLSKIDNAITILQTKINTISTVQQESNITLIIDEIKRLGTRLNELQRDINELSVDEDLYQEAKNLLSGDGLRKAIINKYLPFLEAKINYWLSHLDMFAKIQIDEDLNETIKLRGFDKVRFDACSQGEQAKLTLATVFAFRELLDIKNNSISNFLFLDEIVENIAYDGKIQLFKSLKNISKETGLTVFVVSHSNIIDEVFDEKWEVYKHGNFSKIKVI